MRVKKLEIFGFKSFALKQSISFGEGVTGIVGPNGCGKSNVVDALRWVMGEQNARHLRGGNMQDIIFCGSEKKAPLGFAEVTLTIENNEQDAPLEYNHFSEIEITRRLYKTGESEYEINKQKARLKDISDFFLGTGVGTKAYSIIEQGRVNDVISAKPIDRRLIIEEAAGITKYKAKKIIAERRMESTRLNLSRIIDIKIEVDKRVAALLREKEKLEKVLALKNRIKEIDLHIASHRYLACFSILNFAKASKEKLHNELSLNKQEFNTLEQTFSKIFDEYSKAHEQKRLLFDLENQHKTTIELLKKDLEYTKNTLTDNQIMVSRIDSQLEEIENRKSEIDLENEKYTNEHSHNLKEYERINQLFIDKKDSGQTIINQRLNNLNQERDSQKKIVDAATRAARLQTQITVLREQEQQKQVDLKNLTVEINAKHEEISNSKNRIAVLSAELKQAIERKENLQTNLNSYAQELQKEQSLHDDIKKQLDLISEEKIALLSRLKSLNEIIERCEWSDSGITDLLIGEHKHLIKGVLADIIQVKAGFEDEVERYLTHVLDAAIIANQADLNMAANLLKNKQSKEAVFYLLDNHETKANITKIIGLKSIDSFITISDEKYASLISQLANFFIADNLQQALLHWPAARISHGTIISAEGEMLLPDGRIIIFGQNHDRGVLKRKNEVAQLEVAIAKHDQDMADLSAQLQQSLKKISGINHEKEAITLELSPLALGVVRLEESINQRTNDLAKLEAEHLKLKDKNSLLLSNALSFDEKIASLSEQWSSALEEHKTEEDKLELIRQEKLVVDNQFDTFQQEMKQIEIERASFYEKCQSLANTLAQAQKTLSHLCSQKAVFLEQIDEKQQDNIRLKENERQTNQKLLSLTEEIAELKKMLITVQEQCELLAEKKLFHEEKMGQMQAQGQMLIHKIHEQDLKINDVNHELNALCSRIKEKYHLDLIMQLIDFHHRGIEEKAARKEMDELNRQKDRLGLVNENASLEFDEFSKRSQFLESQVKDLNDGLTQLSDAIKKINNTTKMRFLEAFRSINQQFALVFPRLFNGGKGELVLSDEEDLLNCGVDIIAKPPGKNISSIELMSGGEKALTAISLIMAIFLIKPSPFCLLDEVDAPLDEANVARFSQLIKEMSALSQFIVITHNRKTMECADQLYGVTMEDAGLSKIVSVHVQQAFEALQQPNKTTTAPRKPTQLFLNDV